MSFDCKGLDPKDKAGERFSRSSWEWRPLWAYLCDKGSSVLTIDQGEQGTENNGVVIDHETCDILAQLVHKDLDNGGAKKWIADYYSSSIAEMYPIDIKVIVDFLCFLESCGGFKID